MNPAGTAWAFAPDPSSTREARRRVSDVLEACAIDAAVQPATLVVSELATNAVLHARTPYEVRLVITPDVVRIEVHDRTRRPPTRRQFSDDATSGRGLRVIEQLCHAWGVDPDPDGSGKTVWAEVATKAAADEAVMAFDFDAVDEL